MRVIAMAEVRVCKKLNIVGHPERNISFLTKFQLVEFEDKGTEIGPKRWV
jgi:hypothetical protein